MLDAMLQPVELKRARSTNFAFMFVKPKTAR
jgi:hypothetical protein